MSCEPTEVPTSEESFQDDMALAPRSWNKRTALERYRNVARTHQNYIISRRQQLMEDTVEAFRGAAANAKQPGGGEALSHRSAAATPATAWSVHLPRTRMGEVLNPLSEIEAGDPSLVYLQVRHACLLVSTLAWALSSLTRHFGAEELVLMQCLREHHSAICTFLK